jgi:hypothetical protein
MCCIKASIPVPQAVRVKRKTGRHVARVKRALHSEEVRDFTETNMMKKCGCQIFATGDVANVIP